MDGTTFFSGMAGALVSAVVAYLALQMRLLASAQEARNAATVDYLLRRQHDDRFFRCYNALIHARYDCDKDLTVFAENRNRRSKEADWLRCVLNQYEYLAVGVQRGVYTESILRDSLRTTTVQLWNITEGYIEQTRKVRNASTAYEHFEWLAKRWERYPVGGYFARK